MNLKIFKQDSKICSGLGPVKVKTNWRSTDFSDQLKNIADAIIKNRQPLVNGSEGIKSLRVVEKCYQSKRIKKIEVIENAEAVLR